VFCAAPDIELVYCFDMRTAVLIAALAHTVSAAPVGKIVGRATVTNAKGDALASDIIVYVVGFTEPPQQPSVAAVIAQHDRQFVPDLVAITVGESVTFPNTDPFLHNVFSQSEARAFDLGSFKKGNEKKKDFPAAGVVEVYCNIHHEMAATILVLPNRRHTKVASDGSFTLEGVPVGTWTVFAYARRVTRPVQAYVTVTANGETSVTLTLVRGAEKTHLDKFGERYHDDETFYP
jgi:plastocyanin